MPLLVVALSRRWWDGPLNGSWPACALRARRRSEGAAKHAQGLGMACSRTPNRGEARRSLRTGASRRSAAKSWSRLDGQIRTAATTKPQAAVVAQVRVCGPGGRRSTWRLALVPGEAADPLSRWCSPCRGAGARARAGFRTGGGQLAIRGRSGTTPPGRPTHRASAPTGSARP